MKSVAAYFDSLWQRNPLAVILLLSLLVRLAAVFFSKGYSMHDDHFLVIEISQSWVEGKDVFNWFSKSIEENSSGRNFLYPGLHYLLFRGLETIKITDPQQKMLIVRLLHAVYSLIVVWLGYKLVNNISGTEAARNAALILGLLWIIPSMSVRNLVEVVVVPLLMTAVYILYNKNKPSDSWLWIACAGFLCGLAFPIRYQTILFSAGIGLVMLMERKFKSLILFSGGVLLAIALISGYLEYQLWGYAFQKVVYYFTYNMNNAYEYTSQSWYFYLLLLLMVFIPPLSFFIVVGFARSYKKYTLIFVPTFLFLLAHSFFPNKQERFMFTVLPFFVISGTATIQEFFRVVV